MSEIKLYTSCYTRVKLFPRQEGMFEGEEFERLVPVSISVGKPRFWRGLWEKRLCPTRAMLKMKREDYDRLFAEILDKLDAEEVARSLPVGGVLLCYEKPNVEACHRRIVAEWLEKSLGIVVPEWGFPRDKTPAYASMPWPA